MLTKPSALEAHDKLLADMPPGASHDGATCSICTTREQAGIAPSEQENDVGDQDKRTFTLAEHEAILSDAVQREVAAATSDKDGTITELQGKIDALEAEKASLVTAKETAEQDLEDFKNETERSREIAQRRDARVDAVKAVSVADLDDSYFTEERVTRWAEMADEDFTALLEDLAAPAVATLTTEEASAVEGLEGQELIAKIGDVLAKRREAAGDKTDATELTKRETAAFTGGATPTGAERKEGSVGTFLRKVHG